MAHEYRREHWRDDRMTAPNHSITPPNSSYPPLYPPPASIRHGTPFNPPCRGGMIRTPTHTPWRSMNPPQGYHRNETPLNTRSRRVSHNHPSPRARTAPYNTRNRNAPHWHAAGRGRLRNRSHANEPPPVTSSPRSPITWSSCIPTAQEITPQLRYFLNYLDEFLLAEGNVRRSLPRKILNTADLFCKILRMAVKDGNTYIFNKILNILTSNALCDVKHRNLEAVNKVRMLVEKEFSKLPLEKLIERVLYELSSDVKPPCKNKIEFERQILLLMETYSIHHRMMSDIFNILKEELNIENFEGKTDPEYSKSIRTIHAGIAKVIEQGSAGNAAKLTLSQFINSMLPPPSELLEERPIHPNPLIIIGEYANTQSFLSTHYNLLREDMVQPLRRSIFQYLKGDTQARKSLYIYDQVRFLHPECDLNQGLMYRVEFSMRGVKDPSKVKWDRCERLKFGTLLCIVKALETDKPCFKEVLWGIVSNRDTKSLQNSLQISLKFSSGFEPRVDFSQTYMMLESREVYFESYCHTLSALKSMVQIPFTDVLLGKSLVCSHPLYLENNTLFDLGPIFPDRDETVFACLGSWPDASPVLDESQYRALRLALTKEVSLIQGPPGTGKTYVGAIMLEILLQTKHAYCLELESQLFDKPVRIVSDAEGEPETPIVAPTNFTSDQTSFMSALESPILILTYTNHALDQFLTLLLRFESKIVRIGSKVEQDELLPHCLTELRKKLMPPRYMRDNMESVPYLPGHILELKKKRDNLMRNVYEIRDKMTGVGKKLWRNKVTLHEVHYINPPQSQSIYGKVQPEEDGERLFAWWREGGDGTYSNNAMEKVRESPPKTKSKRKREHNSRAEEEEMYGHPASDDEDEVDDRLLGNEYGDFELEQKQIFQWDELPQVLSPHEKAQIVANLPEIPKKILDVENLWSLSKEDRCALYKHWLALKQKMLLLMVEEMSDQFSALCAEVEELNRQIDLCILKEAAVIGMTTTGAAKNSQLIRQLKPRIVVVEEAAEVLEAHIIANLTPQVQHLILIGDHQQLRPSNAEFALSKHANLDVSLFERLIKNGVEHVTLNYQHRMRPQISSLVRPIYPKLLDHDTVLKRENVYGVKENIFFIDHNIPEDHAGEENTTKTHRYEAIYLSRLANYLLNRGYGKEEITILTFYQGQKFAILDELRRLGIWLRVSTVDKYQGEENRIVLFSVVRSNKANNIGHCKIDNRVCVALSRAKDGLFMIGNSASLRTASRNTKSNLWNKVLDLFEASRISKTFPLICHKHPETHAEINSPDEFEQYNNALCNLPCNEELECGHKCHQLCHYNRKIPCTEPCNRINPDCGHPCVRSDGKEGKLCHERCGKCNYFVLKRLDTCDHEAMLPCYYDPVNYICEELCERKPDCGHPCVQKDGKTRKLCSQLCGGCNYFVNKQLAQCNHEKRLHCHVSPLHSLCELLCEKQLSCGHPCSGLCGEDCLKIECRVTVEHELPCTHIISVLCFEGVNARSKCQKPCLEMLECGHHCSLKCYKDCKSAKCLEPCMRERMCEHPCTKLCLDDCGPCEFPIQKTIENCGHKVELPCRVEPTHDQCDKPCKMILPCGHACAQDCYEDCFGFPCERKVMKYCPCGHKNEMMCCFDSGEYHDYFECRQQCLLLLPCNHICPLKCDADCETAICKMPCERKYECGHPCFDSVTDQPKKCSEECGQCLRPVVKKLSCGHAKEIPCSQNCEGVECFEKVKKELACKHVKEVACSAKSSKVKCLEKCTKKLKCGHPCTKKCFEDCSKSKCKAPLAKKLKCGHTSTVTCHEEQMNELPSCTEPCDKTLDCGHNCTGDCADDCSEIVCQIKPRIRLNCSHSIRFMCSEGNKKYFKNPLEIKHVTNCDANICEICTKIKSKIKCGKKCGKDLGCGHECQEACHHPLECLPCREGSHFQCLHSKAKFLHSNSHLLCGDIENRCEETCEWECKHHSCTLKCWEPCERPVCDEMCSLEQRCGHPCLGLCGEICPEICNTCDKKNDMFHKHVNAPCIKLDCSHIFPVAVLDTLFATVQVSIVTPTCPDCQRPIYNINRYGGSIKKIALKKNEERRRRIHKTQVHITEECKRIFKLNPSSRPLSEFIGIIEKIESEIGNYQLTKLYTIIDVLDVLAGMVNHFEGVWTSRHHTKILQSKSLNRLIAQSISRSEDSDILDWIRNLAVKCEICSIFSILNTRHKSLSSEDALYLKDNYREIFVDTLQDDSKCKIYFKKLSQLALKYEIDCAKSRFSITRPRISIPEEIDGQAESRIGASGGEKTKLKTEKRHSISQSQSNVATSTVCSKTESAAIPTQHLEKNLIPRTIKMEIDGQAESRIGASGGEKTKLKTEKRHSISQSQSNVATSTVCSKTESAAIPTQHLEKNLIPRTIKMEIDGQAESRIGASGGEKTKLKTEKGHSISQSPSNVATSTVCSKTESAAIPTQHLEKNLIPRTIKMEIDGQAESRIGASGGEKTKLKTEKGHSISQSPSNVATSTVCSKTESAAIPTQHLEKNLIPRTIKMEIDGQAESRIGASGGEKTKLKTEKGHSISQSPSNVATSTVCSKTESAAIPTQHLEKNLIPRTIKMEIDGQAESRIGASGGEKTKLKTEKGHSISQSPSNVATSTVCSMTESAAIPTQHLKKNLILRTIKMEIDGQAESRIGASGGGKTKLKTEKRHSISQSPSNVATSTVCSKTESAAIPTQHLEKNLIPRTIKMEIDGQAESRIGASGGEKTKLKTEKGHSISQSPSNVATSTVCSKTESAAIPTQHLEKNLIPRTIKRPVSSTHESEPKPKQPKLSPARTAGEKREERPLIAAITGERKTSRNPRRPRARRRKMNKPRLN